MDEQRLKQLGYELRKFSKIKIYIDPPEAGETKEERQIRTKKIKRRIGEARRKKRIFDNQEEDLKRRCKSADAPYDPPNDREDDEVRRGRLLDFAFKEEVLRNACYRSGVNYTPHNPREDDMARRDRLRDKILESDLKERCKDNRVTYLDPPSQEDKECARIRRELLEELVIRSVLFDVCCLKMHSLCTYSSLSTFSL